MTASPFAAVTEARRVGPGRYLATVSEGWQHGAGAFGGVGLGIASRALQQAAESEHADMLTATFVGPLEVGSVDVQTEPIRARGNTRMFTARLIQGGTTRLVAQSQVVAHRREVDPIAPSRPGFRPWQETPVLESVEYMPPFTQHFEYRLVRPTPFLGGREAVVEGWVRPRESIDAWRLAEIAAVCDAYWPSYFSVLRAPRLAMSVHFALTLGSASRDLDPAAPLLSRARTLLADAGQVLEVRELWAPDGRIAAIATQTLRVVR